MPNIDFNDPNWSGSIGGLKGRAHPDFDGRLLAATRGDMEAEILRLRRLHRELTARLATAEGMAEALDSILHHQDHPHTSTGTDIDNAIERSRAALAAWRQEGGR